MRPIDADKAKEKLRGNAQKDGNPFVGAIVEMFCEFLDQAPTVEDAEERGEIGRVPRWIPVTERMPENAGDYLCVCIDGESEELCVVIIQYNDEREAFGHESNVYDHYTLGFVDTEFEEWPVTHWRPLPETPEVE